MAIHGPRKLVDRRKTEQTFYDTLTDKQKENWRKLLANQVQIDGSVYFVERMPLTTLKDAINTLHKRIMVASDDVEKGKTNE